MWRVDWHRWLTPLCMTELHGEKYNPNMSLQLNDSLESNWQSITAVLNFSVLISSLPWISLCFGSFFLTGGWKVSWIPDIHTQERIKIRYFLFVFIPAFWSCCMLVGRAWAMSLKLFLFENIMFPWERNENSIKKLMVYLDWGGKSVSTVCPQRHHMEPQQRLI